MRTLSWAALALSLLVCGLVGQAIPQEALKEKTKPLALFNNFRELMTEGKYDIAAIFLQQFLDSNPSEAEFLEIEKRYGTTVFLGLRNIARWSDDAGVDKKARANVEEAIKRSKAASEKLLRNPARVAKYIRNLAATYEERAYAELELKRTGDYAIPFMVEELRLTRDKDMHQGLLESIGVIEPGTISGWVAALDGLPIDKQFGVVNAISSRDDMLKLVSNAQSDLTPFLWRVMAQPRDQNPAFRALAEKVLNQITRGPRADSQLPEQVLTDIARTFYDHKANYATLRRNPDGTPQSVPMWIWDARSEKLVKHEEVPLSQAEEYYGLRYARWVLDGKPGYEPAQGLLISLAAERAIERARFGNLARTEPAVFKLLSDAPSKVLAEQLNHALNQKKAGLALAMIQILGDRGDRDAATPPAGPAEKPSLLVKALSFPDPQVQFAAAHALLRSPVSVPYSARPLIVDILRRAAALDPGAADSGGKALLADPSRPRADAFVSTLRGMGYQVEIMGNGRDLLRRVAQSSDFDVIFIDHHTPNPELIDLIGQLQSDVKTANRPIFVVASADKLPPPTFDQLILRFAALVAATENYLIGMEKPYVVDPRDVDKADFVASERAKNLRLRDSVYQRAAEERSARLNRLIESTGIQLTDAQKLMLKLRVELINYAILGHQYPFSEETAPGTMAHVVALRKQLEAQPPSAPYGAGLPTRELMKMMERFEIDLARVPVRQKEAEDLHAKLDPSEFGIVMESFRDLALEARLARQLRNYPNVRIIPEPLSRTDFANSLRATYADPAQAPRDPAEKKAAQKHAIEWLRKMAIGEITGYELKAAEAEIRSALQSDDLAGSAIDAVVRFNSAAAQENLLTLAISPLRPLPLRTKAADAVIEHIQKNGKSIPKSLIMPLTELSGTEADLTLRGKLLSIKGLLAPNPEAFVDQLKTYNPPLIPPLPGKAPGKEPAKEPEKDPAPKEQ